MRRSWSAFASGMLILAVLNASLPHRVSAAPLSSDSDTSDEIDGSQDDDDWLAAWLPTLLAYLPVGYAFDRLGYRFEARYRTRAPRLWRLASELFHPSPRQVLYLNLVSGLQRRQADADFRRRYGAHPNADLKHFNSRANLEEFFQEISTRRQLYDRVEIVAHGGPGGFELPNGEAVDSDYLDRKLTVRSFRPIVSRNADVVFMSCNLAASVGNSDPGDEFLRLFRRAFLRLDSRVLASQRVLFFDDLFDRVMPVIPGLTAFVSIVGTGGDVVRDWRLGIRRAEPFTLLDSAVDRESCIRGYRELKVIRR